MLAAQEPFRIVAKRFGVSPAAAHRHRQNHLAPDLLRAERANSIRIDSLADFMETRRVGHATYVLDLLDDVEAMLDGIRKIFDACAAWLVDPNHPDRYDLGPRAGEVLVRYYVAGPDGRPVGV